MLEFPGRVDYLSWTKTQDERSLDQDLQHLRLGREGRRAHFDQDLPQLSSGHEWQHIIQDYEGIGSISAV